jgi:hypothetical protein
MVSSDSYYKMGIFVAVCIVITCIVVFLTRKSDDWVADGTWVKGSGNPFFSHKNGITYQAALTWINDNHPEANSWVFGGNWKDPKSVGKVSINLPNSEIEGDNKTFTGFSQVFVKSTKT